MLKVSDMGEESIRVQNGYFFNLTLTERNMQVRIDLKVSVYLLGLGI